MKKRKHQVIAAIFMVSLMSFWASDFFGAKEEKEFDAQTREKMEKSLDKAMEESRSPGAIAAVWAPGKFKYGLGVDKVGEGFIGHAGAVNGYYHRATF